MSDNPNVAVLLAMRSVFDTIPPPCAERDALDAAIALSAQASAPGGECDKADAERYRWLRDRGLAAKRSHLWIVETETHWCARTTLDEAIDAAAAIAARTDKGEGR